MTALLFSAGMELAQVVERVILPRVKGGGHEVLEHESCRSLLRYIVILRSLISEKDAICAAMVRVG